MKRVHCTRIILASLLIFSLFGCKKKDGQQPGAAPGADGVKSISGQAASGEIALSPQDQADAEAAGAKVLALMESGDFATIYRDAEAGFKKIGPEEKFVAAFQQTRQKTGPLKNPRKVSMTARPNKTIVVVYRMDNDRFVSDRRLTFLRSKAGKMELFGLNQHDEPKAPASQAAPAAKTK